MAENKRVASKIQLYHIGFASFKIYARTDPETKSYSIKKERKFQIWKMIHFLLWQKNYVQELLL